MIESDKTLRFKANELIERGVNSREQLLECLDLKYAIDAANNEKRKVLLEFTELSSQLSDIAAKADRFLDSPLKPIRANVRIGRVKGAKVYELVETTKTEPWGGEFKPIRLWVRRDW